MACKTCTHTMQGLGTVAPSGMRWFWCNRCGTLKREMLNDPDHGQDQWDKPLWIDRTPDALAIIKGERRVEADLLEACKTATGAYEALAESGLDLILPSFASCRADLKAAITKAEKGGVSSHT